MMDNTINGRTPEEIKKGLELCCVGKCSECPYIKECDEHLARGGDMLPADVVLNDIAALIQQLERERDVAVRTAQWQFEKRSDGSVTELPVCSGCGATPKYYVPMNDVGMQVPPYCHECGSRMAPVVKMEVEK